MLLLRLWNYIRGYVIIVVEGYFLEKFMNICIHRQIFLWDIKKQKNCTMSLKVSIDGFRMLRSVAYKTKCRIRIARKRGLPFVLNRYRSRKTFAIGAALFIFIIWTLSSFIWTVDISGNKKIESKLILDKLAEFGIKSGVLKYGIDTDRVSNNMMIEIKELGWIGVTIKGTKAKIEIKERVNPPELVPKDKPCDIVAKHDGVIKLIVAKAGQEMVKAGDTVTKGQVIISSSVPIKGEENNHRLVHAIGSAKARTWYEGTCAVDTKTIEKERTGKSKDIYSLGIFTKKIILLPGKITFENYDKIEIKKSMSFGENTVFPFEFVIDRYYENTVSEKEISIDEAKQIAADKAYTEASKDIDENAEIVKSDTKFIQNDEGTLTANAIIECVEEIGITEEIGGK